MLIRDWHAGKGVLGWVAVGPELTASPIKGKDGPQDAKVVLGNKQMMADEGIPITKAVDDYMRDMEVRHAVSPTYCTSSSPYTPPLCLHMQNYHGVPC